MSSVKHEFFAVSSDIFHCGHLYLLSVCWIFSVLRVVATHQVSELDIEEFLLSLERLVSVSVGTDVGTEVLSALFCLAEKCIDLWALSILLSAVVLLDEQ